MLSRLKDELPRLNLRRLQHLQEVNQKGLELLVGVVETGNADFEFPKSSFVYFELQFSRQEVHLRTELLGKVKEATLVRV